MNDDQDRVWELMEEVGFCMLATHDGKDIRARPMAAHVERDENCVYFLTDAGSPKDQEIEEDFNVCLAFSDGSRHFVSVSGTATVSNDRAKISELWSTPAKAWWDSPDDPSIRVLKVAPAEAQYWDTPGKAVSYVKMAAAAVTGSRPDLGDHAKVRM